MINYTLFYSDLSDSSIKSMINFITLNNMKSPMPEVTDVSDVSILFDYVFKFTFDCPEDAAIFKLKFPKK